MFKKYCVLLAGIFIFSPSAIGADQIDDVYKSLFRIQVEQAKKGNAHDQFAVGEMFEKGLGTPKDLTKANFWYKKSADQGFREARRKLDNWTEARAAEERVSNLARQREQRRFQQQAARKQARDQRRAAAAAKKKEQPKRKQKKKVAKKAPAVTPVPDKKQKQVEKMTTADNKVADKPEKKAKDTDEKKTKGFSVNPCEGATARFLTTCSK